MQKGTFKRRKDESFDDYREKTCTQTSQSAECYNRWSKNPKIVNSATLLGLRIDNMLSFNLHVEMICKRLSSRIGVLRKIRVFLLLSAFYIITL